jgi:uncharacterized protein YhdP
MAKKELRTLVVKGKYAEAVVKGAALDKEIKAKTESLKDHKDLLQDKTMKIDETEQSIKLQAEGTDVTATLTAARTVTMIATNPLKQNLMSGMYNGTVNFDRTVRVNLVDVDKVLAILAAAGIKADDVWTVTAKAADLDKYREEKGVDQVLGDAYTVEEVYKIKF